jgi:hypothetical protein
MKRHCPRYDKEFKKAMNSPEVHHFNKKHEKLYNYVSEHTGKNITNAKELRHIYNTLYIEASYCLGELNAHLMFIIILQELKHMELPEWTKEVYPDKMREVGIFSFALPTQTKELKRLKSGIKKTTQLHTISHFLK